MKKTEIAWAAGIVEGEGCVAVHRGRMRNDGWQPMYVRLTVSNTEIVIIEKLHELFGGTIYKHTLKPNPRHNQAYVWSVQNSEACRSMKLMQPFFVARSKAAKFERIMIAISKNKKKEPTNNMARSRRNGWGAKAFA